MTEISIHYCGEIVTKKEAIEMSLGRYFTGKPCKHGHIAERYTITSGCCECSKYKNRKNCKQIAREHYKKNKEYFRLKRQKWRKNNPEKRKAAKQKRRALIKNNTKGKNNFTGNDIINIRIAQKQSCANCKIKLNKENEHIDHIIPLSLGGDNSKYNIQLLCSVCNVKKGAKNPIDWAQENGRLL